MYREALATCALTVEAKRSKHRNAWHQILDGYVFVMHDLYYCAIVTFYVCVCYCLCLMYCIILMMCVITCMFVYVCAYVVGIKAPESLCYLLMYINPTLNKDYLLTDLLTYWIINSRCDHY